MFGSSSKYSPVAASDEEKDQPQIRQQSASARYIEICWKSYSILLHLIVFLLIVAVTILSSHGSPSGHQYSLLASELPFARDAFDYVNLTFTPAGFTDSKESPSPYFGSPNPENNKLWEELYNVGMTVITREENDQLQVETTHLVGDSEHYLVTIEVFHQLHCLDYLRHAAYSSASGEQTHHPGESEWSKSRHLDHCIEYLRQVLTCHGDLTPITLETIPGVPVLPLPNPPPYKPNFSIRHTCRNFDQIYDFALQRNTSGYKVA
ncbi:hypothetical protein BJ166DRAFT_538319 [Pestalotiopsis sp. NC0098]|nr:hypothetical protein BJ166DRAFT_538319 [Pestalotiopsis sp. NC0098]